MKTTAHYTATRNLKFVQFGVNGRVNPATVRIHVSGKAEARKIAAFHGAQCWNF